MLYAQQVFERVGEVELVELARLRRLSLVAAVRAEVGAGAVGPRSVVAAVAERRVVGADVHPIGETVGDPELGVRRTEHAVDDLLADDRLRLEHRIDVERIVVGPRIEQPGGIGIGEVRRPPERRHGERVAVCAAALALIRIDARRIQR